MASQQTGHLDKDFLGSTYTLPASSSYANARGTDEPRLFGNRRQRTFNRTPKGAVTHVVTSSGTLKIRPNSPNTL